ncbi:MAG: phosphate regulon sensor histidine kinase PhoR [endosymbiont of Galathealinum brachiosum]|uniref:histidine kinase n=1 Tax=endosymbiont of Galathealinum brachiosum TaxID=2200906 RepID=A0A370DGG0_9GAMM|nr:MAG: phosphate regulon sensor histidine kinase PhoR [endosymbiont of Galathealinum brachiosum]
MTFSSSLQHELSLLTLWLIFMLVIGSFFGIAMTAVFVGLLGYVVWHLYNLNRLVNWLNKPSNNTPEATGIWDDAFFQLHNQYKRQRGSRKRLTKILKQFQKSTKALPYATIVLNSNNEIEWFNPASKILFGLRSGLDVGQRIDNLIRQPEFIKYLNGNNFKKPLEFDNQNQKLLLNVTSYGQGQYLLSARDITQRIKLDEMRRDFISNASHELRTPITVMSGYIETLQNNCDEINKYPVDKIYQQTIRMEKIIAELIELAKLETSSFIGTNVQIDTIALLNEVYNEAVSLDQGSHDITIEIEPIKINGSYEEIRTAISNLLTNAVRYTPDNGFIKLTTSTDSTGSYIHVEDNGDGIGYEHISRLTERFYRVDEGRSREKGGTGLGLAIVKQILDRHGAVLQIESEINKGTVFSCYFPFT